MNTCSMYTLFLRLEGNNHSINDRQQNTILVYMYIYKCPMRILLFYWRENRAWKIADISVSRIYPYIYICFACVTYYMMSETSQVVQAVSLVSWCGYIYIYWCAHTHCSPRSSFPGFHIFLFNTKSCTFSHIMQLIRWPQRGVTVSIIFVYIFVYII